MKGYTYILQCSDGSYYTGSTTDLELRLQQHNQGIGANHTRKSVLWSWSIMKNTRVSMKLFTEKSKYRAGAGERKKL